MAPSTLLSCRPLFTRAPHRHSLNHLPFRLHYNPLFFRPFCCSTSSVTPRPTFPGKCRSCCRRYPLTSWRPCHSTLTKVKFHLLRRSVNHNSPNSNLAAVVIQYRYRRSTKSPTRWCYREPSNRVCPWVDGEPSTRTSFARTPIPLHLVPPHPNTFIPRCDFCRR
ncbi:hypothetical protein BGY98DRAFT_322995 [Russula aff. rugulosa BPL654]|nr:hypothetical protein BGY98DRAFT_322995 [Russula aff. rugulosa BPL654]